MRGGGGRGHLQPHRPHTQAHPPLLLPLYYSHCFIPIQILTTARFSDKPFNERLFPVDAARGREHRAGATQTQQGRTGNAKKHANKERTHDQRNSGAKVSIFCGLCGTQRSVRTWTLVGYCLSICPLASIPRSAPSVTATAKPHPFPAPPVASESVMASQDGSNGRMHFSFLLFFLLI